LNIVRPARKRCPVQACLDDRRPWTRSHSWPRKNARKLRSALQTLRALDAVFKIVGPGRGQTVRPATMPAHKLRARMPQGRAKTRGHVHNMPGEWAARTTSTKAPFARPRWLLFAYSWHPGPFHQWEHALGARSASGGQKMVRLMVRPTSTPCISRLTMVAPCLNQTLKRRERAGMACCYLGVVGLSGVLVSGAQPSVGPGPQLAVFVPCLPVHMRACVHGAGTRPTCAWLVLPGSGVGCRWFPGWSFGMFLPLHLLRRASATVRRVAPSNMIRQPANTDVAPSNTPNLRTNKTHQW
jgi:hypothetical protein